MKKKPVKLTTLQAKAQKVFNAYIRKRDEGLPCISCGKYNKLQAGHYVAVKTCNGLRFNEDNVNGECGRCNGCDQSHLIGYRRNLIRKIGEFRVLKLEDSRHLVHRWEREDLEQIIEYYSKKLAEN